METMWARMKGYVIAFIVILVLGSASFMLSEGLTLGEAMYFVVVTIATVGYGDIHPSTPLGRFLAILLIFTGAGIFLGVVATGSEVILSRRERMTRLEKIHMMSGLFFSELGTRLLQFCVQADPGATTIRGDFLINGSWTAQNFASLVRKIESHRFAVEPTAMDLPLLRSFLLEKRDFLVRLLENPTVMEHESFTDLLRAVFHLADELLSRSSMEGLPPEDIRHLAGDLDRAYRLIVLQWAGYMEYLKDNYPYLFSLAIRTNPFDPSASVVVKS